MSTPISGDIQCWFWGFHWWTGLQFQQFLVPQFYSIPVCVALDCHDEFSLVKRCLFNTSSELKAPRVQYQECALPRSSRKIHHVFFWRGWFNGLGPVVSSGRLWKSMWGSSYHGGRPLDAAQVVFVGFRKNHQGIKRRSGRLTGKNWTGITGMTYLGICLE